MDAQLKDTWIKALRSGNYKQTGGTLRDGDSFCCLGVLCDLSARGDWIAYPTSGRPNLFRFKPSGSEATSLMFLPPAIRHEEALTDEILDPVMDMNDEGKSFVEIADWLEKHL